MASSISTPIIVEAINTVSLEPHIDDPEIARLLPKNGEHPVRSSVIIHGINNAIANGIRRVLLNEMDNLALYIDQDSFMTDDPFIMIDMITRRIKLMPLVQEQVHEGMRFYLDAVNDTDEPMDVMSAKLILVPESAGFSAATKTRARKGKISASHALPFFETINVVTLQPHKKIQFTAEVVRGNGMDDAAFATAFTVQSIPLDERPIDLCADDPTIREPYLPLNNAAKYVQSSSSSNPHVYQIIFETVGKGAPTAILSRAITILIMRMQAVAEAQIVTGQERQSSGSSARATSAGEDIAGLYTIKIPGETQTIGNLFIKCCYEVFPHIDLATYDMDDLTSELIIRIRTNDTSIKEIRRAVIEYTVGILEGIKRFFD